MSIRRTLTGPVAFVSIYALSAALSLASMIALAMLATGCASMKGKVGDGKLEPVTKATAKAALTAGAVAAPEYAAANAEAAAQAAAYTFPAPEVVVPVLDANGERTGTARLLVDSAGQIVVVTDTA